MCETGSILQIVICAIFLSISLGLAGVVAYKKSQYPEKALANPTEFRNVSYIWLFLVVLQGIISVVLEANENVDCSIAVYVLAALSFVVSCYSALVLRDIAQTDKRFLDMLSLKTQTETQTETPQPADYHGVPMRF